MTITVLSCVPFSVSPFSVSKKGRGNATSESRTSSWRIAAECDPRRRRCAPDNSNVEPENKPSESCLEKFPNGAKCPERMVDTDNPDVACVFCNQDPRFKSKKEEMKFFRDYFNELGQAHYTCFIPPKKRNGNGISVVCGKCCDDSTGKIRIREGCTCQTKGDDFDPFEQPFRPTD